MQHSQGAHHPTWMNQFQPRKHRMNEAIGKTLSALVSKGQKDQKRPKTLSRFAIELSQIIFITVVDFKVGHSGRLSSKIKAA